MAEPVPTPALSTLARLSGTVITTANLRSIQPRAEQQEEYDQAMAVLATAPGEQLHLGTAWLLRFDDVPVAITGLFEPPDADPDGKRWLAGWAVVDARATPRGIAAAIVFARHYLAQGGACVRITVLCDFAAGNRAARAMGFEPGPLQHGDTRYRIWEYHP